MADHPVVITLWASTNMSDQVHEVLNGGVSVETQLSTKDRTLIEQK